jgi:outer membrane protein TolC
MKSPSQKISICLSILTYCIALHAQAKSVLNWEQCVKELKTQNPELSSTDEAIYSAEAKKRSSWSGFFPQLSANAGLTHGNSGLTLEGNSTLRDQYSLGVTATESIFSGFKDYYQVAKAKRGLALAQATQDGVKVRLSQELKSSFAALIYNQEQLNLSATIVKRRQDNMRMVKLRYEGGRENKGSFLFSKASLEQALFENQQIQRATEVAKLNLARVLGRSADLDFDVSGSLTWNPVEPHPDFKKWVHETPDYRQAEAQWQVSEADSSIARGDFFPQVALQGSYSKVGSNFPPDTKRWSVGISIAFPFFPGGQNIFNYQSANAEAHKADLLKTNADNVILAKLQQTHAALVDAIGLQKVAKEFVDASEARAIVSRGKYQTGLMSFEDWDLIETDLINRQKTELQSRRDVVIAEATFEQAQGKSVFP